MSVHDPASTAGLPASACVSVGPPLFWSGPSCGSVLTRSPRGAEPACVRALQVEAGGAGTAVAGAVAGGRRGVAGDDRVSELDRALGSGSRRRERWLLLPAIVRLLDQRSAEAEDGAAAVVCAAARDRRPSSRKTCWSDRRCRRRPRRDRSPAVVTPAVGDVGGVVRDAREADAECRPLARHSAAAVVAAVSSLFPSSGCCHRSTTRRRSRRRRFRTRRRRRSRRPCPVEREGVAVDRGVAEAVPPPFE